MVVWSEQEADSQDEWQKSPEEMPTHHSTPPTQHKTIVHVHARAYNGTAVVEGCISLVCNKFSLLGLEKRSFCYWRMNSLRRCVSCFDSDGEGVRPENDLVKVLGLLTKGNWISWKWAIEFLLVTQFLKNETSKLMCIWKRSFKSPST